MLQSPTALLRSVETQSLVCELPSSIFSHCGLPGHNILHSAGKSWTALSARCDQLRYLERLSNDYLPPLPSLNQKDSTISVFDFASKHKLNVDISMSKASLDSSVWQYINLHRKPRVQRFVDDVEASPDEFRLVEGVFMYDFIRAVFVLAKVRYYPDNPLDERYRVVNGMFRLRSVLFLHLIPTPLLLRICSFQSMRSDERAMGA